MTDCVLCIDTSDQKKTVVRVQRGEMIVQRQEERGSAASQVVLSLVEATLTEAQLTLSDLTEVQVHTGPGSFTGLRVGAAVAQTIAWLMQIPLNGTRGKGVDLIYQNSRW